MFRIAPALKDRLLEDVAAIKTDGGRKPDLQENPTLSDEEAHKELFYGILYNIVFCSELTIEGATEQKPYAGTYPNTAK